MSHHSQPLTASRMIRARMGGILLALFLSIILLGSYALSLSAAGNVPAAGGLSVEILAGYNVVVDSNATAPSTYAPSVATVAGNFCNDGGTNLSNVQGFIGDYTAVTPGVYPARDSSQPAFQAEHPHLANTGDYAFTHVGGSSGVGDATRFIGDLGPGQCKVQYWHIIYPQCDGSTTPPCTEPVWGETNDPSDDLWLTFDIWGTADGGANDNQSWTMTMRNMISAMANKIKPNPSGLWFNTDTSSVRPGAIITTNGILYSLGNIRQGFDNDNDFVPDYNAWMQPIGDASYDPSCFRLIRTSGVLTVSRSAGQPDYILPFEDQLYFTNLPSNNTGAIGEVFYTFMALNGPCSTGLTPYQEVASGFDNEKFNGDFGTGIPPVGSSAAEVIVEKSGSPDAVATGGTVTYILPFQNSGTSDAGLTLSSGGINMPLVISDTVPDGLQYSGGTAGASFSFANTGITIRFSTDSGQSWTTTDPGTTLSSGSNSRVIIQWWLNDPLPAGESGQATFQAIIPGGYGGSPFIENEGCASFGGAADFACDDATTMVLGNNSIGDTVWQDDNANGMQDAGEPGIANITVSLYWDRNGDGMLDDNDPFISSLETDGSGYYLFEDLPDGDYLAVVDQDDADLPVGYGNTTPIVHSVTGLGGPVDYEDADFGFGPVLLLDKQLVSGNPAYEGDEVTFTIDLTNNRPGNGSGQGSSCTYTFWAPNGVSGNSPRNFTNPANAWDGNFATFASADWTQGSNRWLYGTDLGLGDLGGEITQVEALFHIYVLGTLNDDFINTYLTTQTFAAGANNPGSGAEYATSFPPATLNTYLGANNAGLLAWDLTALNLWDWDDFTNPVNPWRLLLEVDKNGGGDAAQFYVSALGLRITSDQQCGGADDTIDPVPLSDQYDADQLQFVSAVPAPNSVTTGAGSPYANTGTIDWNNVGPLHAGQTQVVTVTFLALEPPSTPFSTTNYAAVTGATFSNGRPVNDADDEADVDIEPTGSLSGVVWNDNGLGGGVVSDGVQNGGEEGIGGVTVYLCTTSPCNSVNAVASTVTAVDGSYTFAGLQDDDYYTAVETTTLPGGAAQTGDPDEAGLCTTCDHQTTGAVNISGAADVTGIDYGYTVANNIYGTVWQDNGGDSFRGAGDDGINGVTVHLCTVGISPCDEIASTTTDSDGFYRFNNVPDGSYYVQVDNNAAPLGPDWNNTRDPEGAPGDHQSDSIAVSGGNSYGSYDFGYHQTGPYTISGTIYADWNENSDHDSVNEPGFAGVTVTLYSSSGAVISTTTTAADGSYSFNNLPDGTFTVAVDESGLPAQYDQTEDYDSGPGVPCVSCDGQGTVTLSGGSVGDVDFGYGPAGYATIGDYVWNDSNSDGLQAGSESGLDDITVWLELDLNGDGNYQPVMTTTTGGGGLYSFDNLPPGSYRVIVDTADGDLPQDGYGNRYVLTTAGFITTTLSSGQTYLDADFGFATGAVAGDTIYADANGNAQQDWNEPGIAGVTVWLYEDSNGNGQPDGTPIMTATTTATGFYLFTGLPAADYVVVVDGSSPALAGLALTGDPDTNGIPCDPAPGVPWDSYCDGQTAESLSAGQIFLGADFGYRPLGIIGDYVWLDLNGDGLQDAGEARLSGVLVTVTNGSETYTTTTDFDGLYSFSGLDDGSWTVTFAAPANLTPTVSSGSALVSGIGSTGATAAVIISGGEVTTINGNACTNCSLHIDAGFRYDDAYSLSGTVFYDSGNDGGLYDAGGGDTPFAGITLYLWDSNGLLGSTTTAADGSYSFTNLPAGDYTVSVNQNVPELSNSTLTTLDPLTPESYLSATLNSGNPSSTDNDFGFFHDAPMDFGDLPAQYGMTKLGNEGARHIIGALYLGGGVSSEADGCNDSVTANCDTLDDGIEPVDLSLWTTFTTVQLSVTVSGSNGYLVGWFDWNGDGDITDNGEQIVFGSVPAGTSTVNVTIPAEHPSGSDIYVRFRLYDGTPGTINPTGLVNNGEVEDYQWTSAPTAVTLNSNARAAAAGPTAWPAAFGLLALLTLGGWIGHRRRQLR